MLYKKLWSLRVKHFFKETLPAQKDRPTNVSEGSGSPHASPKAVDAVMQESRPDAQMVPILEF